MIIGVVIIIVVTAVPVVVMTFSAFVLVVVNLGPFLEGVQVQTLSSEC